MLDFIVMEMSKVNREKGYYIDIRHIVRHLSTWEVANGKIRDFPRRQDPCLKIRDRALKVLTKSEPRLCTKKTEPETSFCENLGRF